MSSSQRRVLLAKPRGYCAGVDRAVQAVEMALEKFGPPVYVRRQIVHNTHVVSTLEKRGAVFVTEVGEVLAGTKPGRLSADEITIYKSTGHAVEDAAAARLVYDKAKAEGAGVTLQL